MGIIVVFESLNLKLWCKDDAFKVLDWNHACPGDKMTPLADLKKLDATVGVYKGRKDIACTPHTRYDMP